MESIIECPYCQNKLHGSKLDEHIGVAHPDKVPSDVSFGIFMAELMRDFGGWADKQRDRERVYWYSSLEEFARRRFNEEFEKKHYPNKESK